MRTIKLNTFKCAEQGDCNPGTNNYNLQISMLQAGALKKTTKNNQRNFMFKKQLF